MTFIKHYYNDLAVDTEQANVLIVGHIPTRYTLNIHIHTYIYKHTYKTSTRRTYITLIMNEQDIQNSNLC